MMKYGIVSVLLLAAVVCGQDAPSVVGSPTNITTNVMGNFTALSQTDALRIRLRDIPALTFKAGKLATRQRTPPEQQLKCLSGCFGELPSSAQCENKGWDGATVSWKCQATVERGRKLENTKVRCEAFTEGDREYILAGSCVLDYTLGGRSSGGSRTPPSNNPSSNSSSKSPLQYIVPIIMIIILVVIVCAVAKACRRSSESAGGVVMGPPPGQAGVHYGGGGAYPSQPGFNPGYGQPGYVAPMAAPMSAPGGGGGNALGAGLGGFAAGAATGGLLGYMMGNQGNSGHSYGHSYGTYGGNGGNAGDYNAGDMGGGGGYEMSTDFADSALE